MILAAPGLGEFAPPLEPTELSRGNVLNPLHPIHRISGVRPGQRWRQPLVDTQEEIIRAALAKMPGAESAAATLGHRGPRWLDAVVRSATEVLDSDHGPTECLVVADDSANPAWVAADLLAQAEHDPLACSILITPDHHLAEAVDWQVARLSCSSAEHDGIEFVQQFVRRVVDADFGVVDEVDAFGLHLLNPPEDDLLLVQFHVGYAVHEQSAGAIGAFKNRDPMAGSV